MNIINNRITKLGHSHSIEYEAAIENDKVNIYTLSWKNVCDILQNEVNKF